MAFLIPDVTRPVRLALSVDDAKREAFGRTLGMVGAVTGLVGGVMVLTANPAVRDAVKRGTGVNLTIAPAQVKQEAVGKALALIGTAVGLSGSALVFAANPKIAAKLPGPIQRNAKGIAVGLAVALVAGAMFLVHTQNKALVGTRYAEA